MKIAVFSTKPYDRGALDEANLGHRHELTYFEARLTEDTVPLVRGSTGSAPSSTMSSPRL